jgi:kynurenine formamidase
MLPAPPVKDRILKVSVYRMRPTLFGFVLLIALAVAAALAAQQPGARVIDLGHPLRADDPSFDPKPTYQRSTIATIAKNGYDSGSIRVDEHFGTHVDAPSHFAAGGWTVDQIPVERFRRPGVRIDVSKQAAGNADYQVTVADIKAFEARDGAIPSGSIVLIATGWDRFWPDRARYMNEKGGVKHFPGLTAEASTYLARDKRVAAIGIDTPSIDHGPSTKFEAHHASMALNVYHIENAARLTTLPASGFEVVVAPINIAGGSGGPARVFAFLK